MPSHPGDNPGTRHRKRQRKTDHSSAVQPQAKVSKQCQRKIDAYLLRQISGTCIRMCYGCGFHRKYRFLPMILSLLQIINAIHVIFQDASNNLVYLCLLRFEIYSFSLPLKIPKRVIRMSSFLYTQYCIKRHSGVEKWTEVLLEV